MKIYEFICENVRYVGSSSDAHTSSHLEQMMSDAKQISFGTFSKAVGIDKVRELFGDYQWGRGSNVRMRNDPYISYFKSKYDGKLCYYVRQAGKEYIFVDGQSVDEDAMTMRDVTREYSIMPDGQMVDGAKELAVFRGEKSPSSLSMTQERSATSAAAKTMYRLARQSKLAVVTSEGEEHETKYILKYLEKFF